MCKFYLKLCTEHRQLPKCSTKSFAVFWCQEKVRTKSGSEKSDFSDFRPILTAPPPKFFHGPKFPKQNCTVLVKKSQFMIKWSSGFSKKWANSGLFCFIIVLFTHNSNIKWKSVDVVPGIRIRSRRMECADGSTVLWRLSDQLFNEQSNCPFLVPNEHWESSKIKWEQISIFDLLLWNLIAWFKSRL